MSRRSNSILGLLSGGLCALCLISCGGGGKGGDNGATTIPGTPTGVAVTQSNGVLSLTWNAVAGASQYDIYWDTSPLTAVPPGIVTYGVTASPAWNTSGLQAPYNLTIGTRYYFVVVAQNSVGESAPSQPSMSAVPTDASLAPAVPQNLTATPGDDQVTLTWSAANGATSYNLYWGNVAGVSPSTGTLIAGVTSPYVHSSLTNNTPYYYVATAQNGSGESLASAPASATPQATANNPTILASGLDTPWGIAVDGNFAYFLSTYDQTLRKVALTGGAVTTLSSTLGLTNGTAGNPIAVDGTNVYWSETGTGNIKTISKTAVNGTPTLLAAGPNSCLGIAIDANYVYWASDGDASIKKVAKTGGGVTTLASGLSNPYCVAVDASYVYWTDHNDNKIQKVDLAGHGPVITLATGLDSPEDLAVDGSYVYWTEWNGWTVKKIDLDAVNPPVTLVPSSTSYQSPAGIAVNATSVYFITGMGVYKVGLDGGTVTTLATSDGGPCLALDATDVYWAYPNAGTGSTAGQILKIPE